MRSVFLLSQLYSFGSAQSRCSVATETTEHQYAGTGDTMTFTFKLGGSTTVTRQVDSTGRWNQYSQVGSWDFGVLPEWDSVNIELSGNNGVNFKKFQISCTDGSFLDLVARADALSATSCPENLWLDEILDTDSMWGEPCYEAGVNQEIEVGLTSVIDCDVGQCSATCGGGTKTCTRTCRNGSFGDQGCPADQENKSEDCAPDACPSVTDCTDYGDCSAECGGGTQTCTRTCVGGAWGDAGCPADQETKEVTCNDQACPIKCPSDTCWTEESDGSCTYNEACPDVSVTCSASAGMAVTFSRDLFDSDETTNFNVGTSASSCQPQDNGAGNAVTWSSTLGSCGIVVSKTADNIVFTKTISALQANDGADITDVNRNAITIYMMEAPGARVNFQCTFPLTASVDSDEVTVTQRVNSGALNYYGNWANAFSLIFTEADYTTQMNPAQNVIGRTLYAAVNFSGLNVPLWWYVNDCSVIGPSSTELRIVANSCYSEFVNGRWGGANTADVDADKKVQTTSTFSYTSFSFGKNPSETQRLRCGIVFCLENDDNANCNLSGLTCPASGDDAIFNYTPYGKV